MKKFLLLLSVFVLVSGYIFYKDYSHQRELATTGDSPLKGEYKPVVLGGTVEQPLNNTISIGKLQTSYIMYIKGDISYDQMVQENIKNLEKVLNYPFNPQKGYLFSVGYDDNSAIQYYYQSDQKETRTVIIRVQSGEKKNRVTKIYDGVYLKLVSTSEGNPNRLLTYDAQNTESYVEVN